MQTDSTTSHRVTSAKGFEIESSFETPEQMQSAIAPAESTDAPASGETPERDEEPSGDAPDRPAATVAAGTGKAADDADSDRVDRRTRDGKKKSIQAEIDALTARKATAAAEAHAAEARLAEARAALATPRSDRQPSASPTVAATGDDPEPTFEQFINEADSATAYYRAVAAWSGRQEAKKHFAQREQQQEAARVQQSFKARYQGFSEKVAAAQTADPAFMGKLDPRFSTMRSVLQLAPGEVPTGETVIADAILDSDQPDRLLLHLSEHRDELNRIAALTPYVAMREMGRLEERLAAASAAQRQPSVIASGAAPPTKPLGGSPNVSAASDDVIDGSVPDQFDKFMIAARARRKKQSTAR